MSRRRDKLRLRKPQPSGEGGSATPSSREVYAFVQGLAAEVSFGRLELPAFPDVVIKLRRALRDEDITHERLARIVAAEAGLAAQVLRMANSAAFSRGGAPLTDLKKALVRIGLKNVRTAALAFAMTQMRMADSVHHIRHHLERLWKDSTLTAALAHVIARRIRSVDPDDALVCGLLHNIGEVYMYSRLDPGSSLMLEREARDAAIEDWNANIGQAIAEHWEMPEAVCEAIAGQDAVDRDHVSRADLTDVLIVASTAARGYADENATVLDAESIRPFDKLGIDHATWEQLIEESREEIDELRAALGS